MAGWGLVKMRRFLIFLAWVYAAGAVIYALGFVHAHWDTDSTFAWLLWTGYLRGLIWPVWLAFAIMGAPP